MNLDLFTFVYTVLICFSGEGLMEMEKNHVILKARQVNKYIAHRTRSKCLT